MTNPETKFKFVPGNTYSMRSVCDHECVWTYLVVRRTAKSVWLSETTYSTRHGREPGPVKRKLISVWRGEEQVQPHGRYSFSPILGAERVVAEPCTCFICEALDLIGHRHLTPAEHAEVFAAR